MVSPLLFLSVIVRYLSVKEIKRCEKKSKHQPQYPLKKYMI